MHRTIGTLAAMFLAASIGSCLDPTVSVGAINAGWLMVSSGALGYVIGSIADAAWRHRS